MFFFIKSKQVVEKDWPYFERLLHLKMNLFTCYETG